MKTNLLFAAIAISLATIIPVNASACTGIALRSADGSRVIARTVEWANTPMKCGYAVVPRGYIAQSLTPTGEDGMKFQAKFGFVGIYTDYENFIVEGINEKGLSAGLFFFPGYGEYETYDPKHKEISICDFQLVSWILSQFSTIDDLIASLDDIFLIGLDPRVGTAHWRVSEPSGRVVVIEYTGGKANVFENKLGVLTNSPGFEWHIANLSNYVNLRRGSAGTLEMAQGLEVSPFGGGSGMLGLPGDFTPASRFIRAAFLQSTAPQLATAAETVSQAFHLLNSFDLPIGMQHPKGEVPEGLPSATQFTSASDLHALRIYYRTAWNSNIRCIDLKKIDFNKVNYTVAPLDKKQEQPVEFLKIK